MVLWMKIKNVARQRNGRWEKVTAYLAVDPAFASTILKHIIGQSNLVLKNMPFRCTTCFQKLNYFAGCYERT